MHCYFQSVEEKESPGRGARLVGVVSIHQKAAVLPPVWARVGDTRPALLTSLFLPLSSFFSKINLKKKKKILGWGCKKMKKEMPILTLKGAYFVCLYNFECFKLIARSFVFNPDASGFLRPGELEAPGWPWEDSQLVSTVTYLVLRNRGVVVFLLLKRQNVRISQNA